jgi:hypothetical protein
LHDPPTAHAAAVCADYPNQAAAQRAADTVDGDGDGDGDGVYCVISPRWAHVAGVDGGLRVPSEPLVISPRVEGFRVEKIIAPSGRTGWTLTTARGEPVAPVDEFVRYRFHS